MTNAPHPAPPPLSLGDHVTAQDLEAFFFHMSIRSARMRRIGLWLFGLAVIMPVVALLLAAALDGGPAWLPGAALAAAPVLPDRGLPWPDGSGAPHAALGRETAAAATDAGAAMRRPVSRAGLAGRPCARRRSCRRRRHVVTRA
jgi:hypothetical protein